MDKLGNVAASSSSGGILLKQDGRVGQVNCINIFIITIIYLFIYVFCLAQYRLYWSKCIIQNLHLIFFIFFTIFFY